MARSNQMLNGGQVIVDYLIREGVPYAFGLCGRRRLGAAGSRHQQAIYRRQVRAGRVAVKVHHEGTKAFR